MLFRVVPLLSAGFLWTQETTDDRLQVPILSGLAAHRTPRGLVNPELTDRVVVRVRRQVPRPTRHKLSAYREYPHPNPLPERERGFRADPYQHVVLVRPMRRRAGCETRPVYSFDAFETWLQCILRAPLASRFTSPAGTWATVSHGFAVVHCRAYNQLRR